MKLIIKLIVFMIEDQNWEIVLWFLIRTLNCKLGFSSKIAMLQLGSAQNPFSLARLSSGNFSSNSSLH